MELKQALGYLLDNGYLVIVANQVVVTRKLTDSLSLPRVEHEVATPQPTTQSATETSVVIAEPKKKKKPMTASDEALRTMWAKFVDDAEVPWRVKSPTGGQYTVSQYGSTAAAMLYRLLQNEEVEYDRLVAATKDYYKTMSYRASLCNFFQNDIWRGAYLNYGKIDRSEGQWGNQFEQ